MNMHKHPDDTSIDPPMLPAFHPGRIQECQDAIAGAVTRVMDNAEEAGWTIAEISIAIAGLADAVMLHEVDLEETNFVLRDMLRR
jgi:hypothetical protein